MSEKIYNIGVEATIEIIGGKRKMEAHYSLPFTSPTHAQQ